MALTSDPLSLIPTLGMQELAWLSVVLMANDMATTGQAPMYAQFVLNLPATLSARDFGNYWQFIHGYCRDMGTAITGGHTGRLHGQNSTVAGGGTMITIAAEGTLLSSNQAMAGDTIVVTKEPALIAASILAKSFPETVANGCGKEIQQVASDLFYNTSALQAGLLAASLNANQKVVSAMHDVTEGGILGAIQEMAIASGCGATIFKDQLPTGYAQQQVCNLFGIDANYCVGAGSMVISVAPGMADTLIKALALAEIKATAVGTFKHKEKGVQLVTDAVHEALNYAGTDPYWNAFFTAFAKGLK